MSDVVRDAIAAELALLTRVLPSPTGDLGFGSDLSCDTDLAEGMLELAGDNRLVVAQSALRRYITPRGSIPDAPNDGLDLMAWVSRGTIADDIRALQGQMASEATKDDRVAVASAVATPSADGSRLSASVRLVPSDPKIAPFEMVVSVTSASALIEEIR